MLAVRNRWAAVRVISSVVPMRTRPTACSSTGTPSMLRALLSAIRISKGRNGM